MARSQEGCIFNPLSVERVHLCGLPHKIRETGGVGFKQQTLLSSEFEGWDSQIRVPVWKVPGEIFLPGWQMAAFFLCPPMVQRDRQTGRETQRENEE